MLLWCIKWTDVHGKRQAIIRNLTEREVEVILDDLLLTGNRSILAREV